MLVAMLCLLFFFFFQAEDGIRDDLVTGVQTCALPISRSRDPRRRRAARHGRVAGEAVRVHVAQRAARDGLLQDPGEPGVRGRSPGRAVADARALHPWTSARYR